jgi:hypothetical protein
MRKVLVVGGGYAGFYAGWTGEEAAGRRGVGGVDICRREHRRDLELAFASEPESEVAASPRRPGTKTHTGSVLLSGAAGSDA